MDGVSRANVKWGFRELLDEQLDAKRGLSLFAVTVLASLLCFSPVTAFAADTPFWRCFKNYCTTHNNACYATLCPKSSYGCSVPCGIFSSRGGPCPSVCTSIGGLYEKHECNVQYMDFATACMSGCVQPDENKAFSCAWKCKSKADELRKQCWILVNEQRVDPNEAVKQVYPTRNKGESAASGDRYIIHKGKIFVINEAKWIRRVQRDLPPELGTFYTDEFDPLRMDWAADSTVLLTGLGTAAAVSVGVMTGGSAIIIGAGVTFVASGLKTFISKSADTMDTNHAIREGLKDGAWDATVGVSIDVATGGAASVAKGAIKSAVRGSAKAVTRKIGQETLEKAIAPVARTQIGKATNKVFQKTFNTKFTWLNPKVKKFPKIKRWNYYWNNRENFYVTMSSGDGIFEGGEAALANRFSGWLNNTTKDAYQKGAIGDAASGLTLRFEGDKNE